MTRVLIDLTKRGAAAKDAKMAEDEALREMHDAAIVGAGLTRFAGKGWWDWRGKMFLLLDVLVAKSLPQSRDCKIKEGAQLQRHRALGGVDNADRHR